MRGKVCLLGDDAARYDVNELMFQRNLLIPSSDLIHVMPEAPGISETPVHLYETTGRYIPQNPHSRNIAVSSLQMQQSLETAWSNVTATRLRTGQSAVRIPAGKNIFLYSKMSRPVVGSTQRSIVTPPCSGEVKNEWSYTFMARTATTLPFIVSR